VPQTDGRIKQVKKNSDIKILFAIIMEKTRFFKHQKYQNLRMNNKARGDKNPICLDFFHIY